MARRIFSVLMFVAVVGVSKAEALPVTYLDPLTNREWASLTSTSIENVFSWSLTSFFCPQDGITACSGALSGGLDLTGWTWATRDQVRELINHIAGFTTELDDYQHSQVDSTWAPLIFSHFAPTSSNGQVLWGLTATTQTTSGRTAVVTGLITNAPLACRIR